MPHPECQCDTETIGSPLCEKHAYLAKLSPQTLAYMVVDFEAANSARRWRFLLWDGSAVEVALSDEDPADMGDPRRVTEDTTVHLTAVAGGAVG